ncbi:MAG TPA: hypothetical protein VFQ67_11200 [Allosphingosinicella sp.]|nr:hypothetical protein [Allosphingosinicella sp.]
MAERLLALSRWSRSTGLRIVIAAPAATKRPGLRSGGPRPCDGESWMPDEDSNLD